MFDEMNKFLLFLEAEGYIESWDDLHPVSTLGDGFKIDIDDILNTEYLKANQDNVLIGIDANHSSYFISPKILMRENLEKFENLSFSGKVGNAYSTMTHMRIYKQSYIAFIQMQYQRIPANDPYTPFLAFSAMEYKNRYHGAKKGRMIYSVSRDKEEYHEESGYAWDFIDGIIKFQKGLFK